MISETFRDMLFEGLTKVGTYSDAAGNVVTMHRNDADPKHLLLVRDGQVVGNFIGDPREYDDELRAHGMTGGLLNLVEGDEPEEELVEDADAEIDEEDAGSDEYDA